MSGYTCATTVNSKDILNNHHIIMHSKDVRCILPPRLSLYLYASIIIYNLKITPMFGSKSNANVIL